MLRELPWSELKRLANEKIVALQWVVPHPGEYFVYSPDGPVTFHTTVVSPSNDYVEFETSYKTSTARRVTTSQTALTNPEDYRFRGTSTAWTECLPGASTDIDITPSATEDRWVDGGVVVFKDSHPGDFVSFKVVHPLVGVVETYVPSWTLAPGTGKEDVVVYPARIPAGIKLRVTYTNTGGTSAWCAVNYRLHRKGNGS